MAASIANIATAVWAFVFVAALVVWIYQRWSRRGPGRGMPLAIGVSGAAILVIMLLAQSGPSYA
jgi:hypothetical protein